MKRAQGSRSREKLGFLIGAVLCALLGSAPVQGGARFPNVPLVTHEGETVRFYDDLVRDRVVVINFIYTRCGDTCPAETAKLRRVHAELGERVGRDIFMYSISIDPEHDTPEVLKAFRERYRIGDGWTFLTGKEEDITLLRKRLGLYQDDIDQASGDHNISLVVGNDRIGKWLKRSPFDNPQALANLIGYGLFDGTVPRRGKSYEDAPELARESRGAYLYRSRCSSCHQGVGDGDNPLGPDLVGVTERRERAWLERWLAEPDVMLEEEDAIAMELLRRYDGIVMPNLRLGEEDVAALIDYMEAQSRLASERVPQLAEDSAGGHAAHHAHAAHRDHAHHHERGVSGIP